MSLSLHSSSEYLGGSNRWSRNDSDIVPEKSSIGLISSKISSRPDCSGMSLRPALRAASTRARHLSLPSSQSKDSVCRARRFGTSSGSLMRAKETRFGPRALAEAMREAANRGPSEGLWRLMRAHAGRSNAEEPPDRGGSTGARTVRAGLGQLRIKPADTRTLHRKRQRAAQKGSVAECYTAVHQCASRPLKDIWQHPCCGPIRQAQRGHSDQFRQSERIHSP